MPRNGSGTYIPPQPPFTPNTTIQSAAVNSNFSDIATALTQSLANNGETPITGQFAFTAGSLSAPGISFSGNLTTGFYLSNTNEITFVNNGSSTAVFSATNNATLSNNLAVGGTLSVTGTAAITGALTQTGAATFNSTTTTTGTATFNGAANLVGAVNLGAASASSLILTQCQLTLVSTNLTLSPYGGNMLFINGLNQIIPSGGVTLSVSGAAASTFYYIYAYMNSGTMTLEYSTTAPATNTTYGIQQKTGDATRTLVGAAYTTSAPAWADTDGQRYVLSYFNRRRKTSYTYYTSSSIVISAVGTGSSAYQEVSSQIRNQFISWNNEDAFVNAAVTFNMAGGITTSAFGIGLDGAQTANVIKGSTIVPNNTYYNSTFMETRTTNITEAAVHYVTLSYAYDSGSSGSTTVAGLNNQGSLYPSTTYSGTCLGVVING